jgi:uncharacterized protein (DUF58 family)
MSQKARTLDITSSRSFAALLSGRYRSMVHGSGIEFSELREYAPGDDVRAIDWKTSARTGHVHTKRFREERSMPVWFALDTGATMRFATGDRSKLATAVEAFSLLSQACAANRDPYGLISYDSTVTDILMPARGPANRALGLQALDRRAALSGVSAGDVSALFAHFYRIRLRHSLVFVLCDEIDGIDPRSLRALAHENDLIFVTVLDSFERSAQVSGTHHAISADGGDLFVSTRDDRARARFAALRQEKLDAFSRLVRTAGARHLVLDDRSDVFREFDRFFQTPAHG